MVQLLPRSPLKWVRFVFFLSPPRCDCYRPFPPFVLDGLVGLAFAGEIWYSTMRVFQTQRVASLDHCSVVHSFVPSRGSSAVRTPAAFPIVAMLLVFRQVYGCVPATIVVGPWIVLAASVLRC